MYIEEGETTEYGIEFPDGTIHWADEEGDYNGRDIRTEHDQDRAQKDYDKKIAQFHLNKIKPRLKFIRRFRTVKYSEPEPFKEV